MIAKNVPSKSHIVNAFHSADKHHSRVSYDKKLMTAKRRSQLRVGPSHSRTDAAVSIRVTCRFVFNGPIVPQIRRIVSALQRTSAELGVHLLTLRLVTRSIVKRFPLATRQTVAVIAFISYTEHEMPSARPLYHLYTILYICLQCSTGHFDRLRSLSELLGWPKCY